MLKDQNIEYSLKFKQLVQASPFNPVTGMCRLCLSEKYFIMFKPDGANIRLILFAINMDLYLKSLNQAQMTQTGPKCLRYTQMKQTKQNTKIVNKTK